MANRKNQTRRPARTYFEQISVDAVQARGVATPVRLVAEIASSVRK